MSKVEKVTKDKWLLVNEKNREIVNEFLSQSVQLSDHTLRQYKSALKIFFYYIYTNGENIPFFKIKPLDYLKFQNYLISIGMSSSGIRLKRSAISSLNSYVEIYYSDIYKDFRNYLLEYFGDARICHFTFPTINIYPQS